MEKIAEKLTIDQMQQELLRREAARLGQKGTDEHCFEMLKETLRVLRNVKLF